MSQVFTNLLLNAKEAMPWGGTVLISARNAVLKGGEVPFLPPGVYLEVSVADRGDGIPPHLFKKIFDPFFTSRKGSQGLGLTTCASIVQKHGGGIVVQSEPGHGTTIHIYLPASFHEAAAETEAPNLRSDPGTILVMDDEAYMREIIREMLKSLGYGVVEAESGEAAMELCSRGQELQGAIIDLTVRGGMTGKDTLAAMRSVLPNLPVFAASGFSEDPIMARPLEFGFTGCIGKPFRKEELAQLLARHLRQP
jgi:CheY-like chemotaxis protein